MCCTDLFIIGIEYHLHGPGFVLRGSSCNPYIRTRNMDHLMFFSFPSNSLSFISKPSTPFPLFYFTTTLLVVYFFILSLRMRTPIAIALACIAAATVSVEALPANCSKTYKVVSGDTVSHPISSVHFFTILTQSLMPLV